MLPPSTAHLLLRFADDGDAASLRRLAALDSARPLGDEVMLAAAGGTPIAAVDLRDGRAIADPFSPSAPAVELLRLRASQLATAEATPRRIRRRRPLFGRLAGLAR